MIIEVVLIAAVAFGSETAPTIGRDTMFAVLMIVLNAVVVWLCSWAGCVITSRRTIYKAPLPTSR